MTTTFDWSAVAPAWEKHANDESRRDAEAAKTDALLERLDIEPGARVLELGAGAGQLGLRLADLVGPDGSVVLSDVAAGMVDILQRRAAHLPHVSVARIDAADTGLDDNSFDAIVFCMGLMFTLEPPAVMKELRRVLKPGGRVGLETWSAPEHNPWLVSVGMAAMMNGVVSGGPPTQPGGLFSLGDPDLLRDVVTAGGFDQVDVFPIDIEFRFRNFDTYFDSVSAMAGPLAAALAAAGPEQVDAVRETASQLTQRYLSADGLILPGRALIALAT